tara:strand:- start:68 stop:811 length:744 start_codon:yes stop_codon:yes gene_type:complete
MVLIEGGEAVLGRMHPRFGVEQMLPQRVTVEDYCVAELPFPGTKGDVWMEDGLAAGDLWLWEKLLHDYGRRFCTVEELVWARASGENNFSFVHGNRRDASCDPGTSSQIISPIGSFEGCINELGVGDVGVSSSWASSSAEVDEARGAEWIRPFVVVGGTARTDTFYAPDNFGIHAHDPGNPPFFDDQLRVCADLGEGLDAEWLDFTLAAAQQGSFEGALRWFDQFGLSGWGAQVTSDVWTFIRDERE